MSSKIKFAILEHLPLSNKGENAILYGFIDMLFPNKEIDCIILDRDIKKPKTYKNIKIFPEKWLYSEGIYRAYSIFSMNPKNFYSFLCRIFRYLLFKIYPNWCKLRLIKLHLASILIRHKWLSLIFKKRFNFFCEILKADIILLGHDGAFSSIQTPHIINWLIEQGKAVAIIGCGLTEPKYRAIKELWISVLCNVYPLVFREHGSFKFIQSLSPSLAHARLGPDPAFAMKAASVSEAENWLFSCGIPLNVSLICFTVVADTLITSQSFQRLSKKEEKLLRHRVLLASLIQYILDTTQAYIIFLPHSIGPSPDKDDRIEAERVVSHLMMNTSRVKIIKDDMDARLLKAIIKYSDMLVGERIHSIINAISSGTPALALTSSYDRRHEIIKYLNLEDILYFLDDPEPYSLIEKWKSIWENRKYYKEKFIKATEFALRELEKISIECRKKFKIEL